VQIAARWGEEGDAVFKLGRKERKHLSWEIDDPFGVSRGNFELKTDQFAMQVDGQVGLPRVPDKGGLEKKKNKNENEGTL